MIVGYIVMGISTPIVITLAYYYILDWMKINNIFKGLRYFHWFIVYRKSFVRYYKSELERKHGEIQ